MYKGSGFKDDWFQNLHGYSVLLISYTKGRQVVQANENSKVQQKEKAASVTDTFYRLEGVKHRF